MLYHTHTDLPVSEVIPCYSEEGVDLLDRLVVTGAAGHEPTFSGTGVRVLRDLISSPNVETDWERRPGVLPYISYNTVPVC